MAVDFYHKHMTQVVPSDPYWRHNCSAYSTAMLITDATLGGVSVTGRIVRAWSDEPIPNPKSPGLNITQMIDVAWKFRVKLYDRQREPWSAIEVALNEGRRIMLQLDYDELPDALRCQKTGEFNHAIVLTRMVEPGFVRASDPLCKVSKKYPVAPLREAARKLARDTGVSEGLRWAATRPVPLLNV